jgi:hypothetical protein
VRTATTTAILSPHSPVPLIATTAPNYRRLTYSENGTASVIKSRRKQSKLVNDHRGNNDDKESSQNEKR